MLVRGYFAMKAYSQSKLAQVMFTFELSERLSGKEVAVNALHPASLMNTKMVKETFGHSMSTIEEGAEATVRLADSPELEAVTGRYFRSARSSPMPTDACCLPDATAYTNAPGRPVPCTAASSPTPSSTPCSPSKEN
jgi:NAD(P)-dependent dehydrogenase (short-subunit alcohol dehydrogenase family)